MLDEKSVNAYGIFAVEKFIENVEGTNFICKKHTYKIRTHYNADNPFDTLVMVNRRFLNLFNRKVFTVCLNDTMYGRCLLSSERDDEYINRLKDVLVMLAHYNIAHPISLITKKLNKIFIMSDSKYSAYMNPENFDKLIRSRSAKFYLERIAELDCANNAHIHNLVIALERDINIIKL